MPSPVLFRCCRSRRSTAMGKLVTRLDSRRSKQLEHRLLRAPAQRRSKETMHPGVQLVYVAAPKCLSLTVFFLPTVPTVQFFAGLPGQLHGGAFYCPKYVSRHPLRCVLSHPGPPSIWILSTRTGQKHTTLGPTSQREL